eukprot:g2219.t1
MSRPPRPPPTLQPSNIPNTQRSLPPQTIPLSIPPPQYYSQNTVYPSFMPPPPLLPSSVIQPKPKASIETLDTVAIDLRRQIVNEGVQAVTFATLCNDIVARFPDKKIDLQDFLRCPTLVEIQLIEQQVETFIRCFVCTQPICTLFDIEKELCTIHGVTKFTKLGIGPLQMQRAVVEIFQPLPGIQSIPPLTSLEALHHLNDFIHMKKGERTANRYKNYNTPLVDIHEYLQYLAFSFSKSRASVEILQVSELCIYIGNIGYCISRLTDMERLQRQRLEKSFYVLAQEADRSAKEKEEKMKTKLNAEHHEKLKTAAQQWQDWTRHETNKLRNIMLNNFQKRLQSSGFRTDNKIGLPEIFTDENDTECKIFYEKWAPNIVKNYDEAKDEMKRSTNIETLCKFVIHVIQESLSTATIMPARVEKIIEKFPTIENVNDVDESTSSSSEDESALSSDSDANSMSIPISLKENVNEKIEEEKVSKNSKLPKIEIVKEKEEEKRLKLINIANDEMNAKKLKELWQTIVSNDIDQFLSTQKSFQKFFWLNLIKLSKMAKTKRLEIHEIDDILLLLTRDGGAKLQDKIAASFISLTFPSSHLTENRQIILSCVEQAINAVTMVEGKNVDDATLYEIVDQVLRETFMTRAVELLGFGTTEELMDESRLKKNEKYPIIFENALIVKNRETSKNLKVSKDINHLQSMQSSFDFSTFRSIEEMIEIMKNYRSNKNKTFLHTSTGTLLSISATGSVEGLCTSLANANPTLAAEHLITSIIRVGSVYKIPTSLLELAIQDGLRSLPVKVAEETAISFILCIPTKLRTALSDLLKRSFSSVYVDKNLISNESIKKAFYRC